MRNDACLIDGITAWDQNCSALKANTPAAPLTIEVRKPLDVDNTWSA